MKEKELEKLRKKIAIFLAMNEGISVKDQTFFIKYCYSVRGNKAAAIVVYKKDEVDNLFCITLIQVNSDIKEKKTAWTHRNNIEKARESYINILVNRDFELI